LEECRTRHLHIDPKQYRVIFGIPSEAEKDYREALSETARRADYGTINMLEEPIGALVDHIFHEDISVRDAQKGILLIDFGGGTCDFAFLLRGRVLHSWGDMNLGGRLFDDLFFQWFLDQNPNALPQMQKNGDEFYVHFYVCRQIKEDFSNAMARDRNEPVRCKMVVTHQGSYGFLKNMTWDEFLHRAKHYSPSETFRRYLVELGVKDSPFYQSHGPVDLLAWFRDCLKEGLQKHNRNKSDIEVVILAGGSSLWPFVPEIVKEVLGIEERGIMRALRPYVAIGEGIALLPGLISRLQIEADKLSQEKNEFSENRRREFQNLLDETVQQISRDAIYDFFDDRVKVICADFRKYGGSREEFEKRVSSAWDSFQPKLKQIAEERLAKLLAVFFERYMELFTEWFQKHKVIPSTDKLSVSKEEIGKIPYPGPILNEDFGIGCLLLKFCKFGISPDLVHYRPSKITGFLRVLFSVRTPEQAHFAKLLLLGGLGWALGWYPGWYLGWYLGGTIGGIAGAVIGLLIGSALTGESTAKLSPEKWKKILEKLDRFRTEAEGKLAEELRERLTKFREEVQRAIVSRIDEELDAIKKFVTHLQQALATS
ncbi:MAG TPA: hypothetical protein PLQ00_10695, partial [Thermoguttaceae bacterium]|nr:hypothetical protein [Thermoguttaceae bacterium]